MDGVYGDITLYSNETRSRWHWTWTNPSVKLVRFFRHLLKVRWSASISWALQLWGDWLQMLSGSSEFGLNVMTSTLRALVGGRCGSYRTSRAGECCQYTTVQRHVCDVVGAPFPDMLWTYVTKTNTTSCPDGVNNLRSWVRQPVWIASWL